MEDRELLALLRDRDERGMVVLLRQYAPLMHYVVSPILPDDRDREECVSEAALRIWNQIDTFDGEKGSFSGWLTAVCRNAALNRVRRKKPEAEALTDLTDESPVSPMG